ncbi:hypothetical protein D3C75_725850 [compost metagenome]
MEGSFFANLVPDETLQLILRVLFERQVGSAVVVVVAEERHVRDQVDNDVVGKAMHVAALENIFPAVLPEVQEVVLVVFTQG